MKNSQESSVRSIISMVKLMMVVACLVGKFLAVPVAPLGPDQEEDTARRLWDKRFVEARAKKKTVGRATGGEPKAHDTEKIVTNQTPTDQLIGVTYWRVRPVLTNADLSKPRRLVQLPSGKMGDVIQERANGDTPFQLGDLVRLSIEVPREADGYLYVIDREVFADGTMSDPHFIFPGQSTPSGGNVVTAGRVIFVPSLGDPVPYFSIERTRTDLIAERLTIIVSPEALPVMAGPSGDATLVDAALLARWETLWGGATEQRQSRALANTAWTAAERDADEGKRRLVQIDPMPQIIFSIKAPLGAPILLNVPLRYAR